MFPQRRDRRAWLPLKRLRRQTRLTRRCPGVSRFVNAARPAARSGRQHRSVRVSAPGVVPFAVTNRTTERSRAGRVRWFVRSSPRAVAGNLIGSSALPGAEVFGWLFWSWRVFSGRAIRVPPCALFSSATGPTMGAPPPPSGELVGFFGAGWLQKPRPPLPFCLFIVGHGFCWR